MLFNWSSNTGRIAGLELPADVAIIKDLRVIRYHYAAWRWAGLWMHSGDNVVVRNLVKVNFFINFVLFNGVMLLHVPHSPSIDETVDTLLPATTTISLCIKACLLMRNRALIRQLLDMIRRLEHGASTEERVFLQRTNRTSTMLICGIFVCCTTTVFGKFVIAALAPARNLMWYAWFPFEWETTESPWPYRSALGFQCVSNLYYCLLFMTVNTYGPMLCGMLNAALHILAVRLRALGTGHDNGRGDRQQQLIECIRYHNICLQYKVTLERLFSVHYALQFGSSSLMLCVIAYLLTLTSPSADAVRTAFLSTYIFNMSNEMLIPCYFGSTLRMTSERLANAAYESGWPNHPDTGFRRALLIFLSGAKRPMLMRTWQKLFDVELPTFVKVWRMAYSMLSFLNGL